MRDTSSALGAHQVHLVIHAGDAGESLHGALEGGPAGQPVEGAKHVEARARPRAGTRRIEQLKYRELNILNPLVNFLLELKTATFFFQW